MEIDTFPKLVRYHRMIPDWYNKDQKVWPFYVNIPFKKPRGTKWINPEICKTVTLKQEDLLIILGIPAKEWQQKDYYIYIPYKPLIKGDIPLAIMDWKDKFNLFPLVEKKNLVNVYL